MHENLFNNYFNTSAQIKYSSTLIVKMLNISSATIQFFVQFLAHLHCQSLPGYRFDRYGNYFQKRKISLILILHRIYTLKCILGMQNVGNWSNVRRCSVTSFCVDSMGGTRQADSSYILYPGF